MILFFYEINHPTAVCRCVPTRFYYYYRVIVLYARNVLYIGEYARPKKKKKNNKPKMFHFFPRFITPDLILSNTYIYIYNKHTHRHISMGTADIGSHDCSNNNNNTDKQPIQRVHSHVVKRICNDIIDAPQYYYYYSCEIKT